MRSGGLIRFGAGHGVRHIAAATALAMATTLVQVVPAPVRAAEQKYKPVDRDKIVDGHAINSKPRKRDASVTNPVPAAEVNWPKASTAEVIVPPATQAKPKSSGTGTAAPAARAGSLPVWVTAPGQLAQARSMKAAGPPAGKVRVQVLDRKASERAKIDGLLFTVGRTDTPTTAPTQVGAVGVRIDYSKFAQAFGGSYGSRLRLVQLPPCALSTPEKPDCARSQPIKTFNNTETKTLSADVNAAPVKSAAPATSDLSAAANLGQATVLAAVAGESSDKGDYKATALQASATWKISPQSGDFTWSYPMRTPPVPGGLQPNLSLGYSSSTIDGRTSNTNTQPSSLGDGFDLWPGYIERRYKSCREDNAPKDQYGRYPGDQCWGYDNATLIFNGKGGELVSAGNGLWRLKNDDGTRIEQLKSSATGNGDNDGEHWKVTTSDGTQYYFGLNKLPGWSDGKPQTNSAWTVPVYGDDDNEPCHEASGFADSWCQQAWRWNLDYVVDPHGNAMTYHYSKETNHYGRNLKEADETPYTRGGWLDHINYGLRSGNLFPTRAPARVDFNVSERCIRDNASDCDPANIKDHPDYWWDVPWDLNCDSGTECKEGKGALGPTFWSRKRLTGITASVINSDGSGYRPVDSWKFTHAWGTADVDRQLLLTSIVHTGQVASGDVEPVAMPPVSFVYKPLPNRVDKLGDDLGPFVKNRLATVYNETGGMLDVNYTAEDCTPNSLPEVNDNHRRCFPIYWDNGTNGNEPALDWFHKYAAAQTVQTDLTGKSPDMVTDYDYSIGQPAWHFDDDDGLTPEKYKTWSQWRGFSKVRVTTRNPSGTPSQVDHWYMQGMDGDRANKDGGTKTVTVSDGEGGTYPDHESLQGFQVRTVTYDKPGGSVLTKTVQSPWHKQTASRTRSWGTVTANLTGFSTARTLTALDGGRWRETKAVNKEFDDLTGQPTQVETLGDTDPEVTNDDRCTTTTLVHNTTAGLLGFPAQVQTVAARCGETVDYTNQLISDVRTYYDKGAFKAAPIRGDVTQVDQVAAAGTTASAVKYVPATKATFDAYGRPLTSTRVDNTSGTPVDITTTTTYTDTQGLATKATVVSPPAQRGNATTTLTTTTDFDPAWGLPTKETDVGGKNTVTSYDPLGRVHKIWSPNRTTSQTPDREYQYTIEINQIVTVLTKKLNNSGGQNDSYELFDGWLRPRQTQSPAPDGGRLITDTFYNALGKVDRSYEAYYANGVPGKVLFGVDTVGDVETQTVYNYDGLGRITAEKLLVGNSDAQERWRTSYSYSGNSVTVTPPQGGTPTTTVTDALGRTLELRQHRAGGPGVYATTTYSYNRVGQLAQIRAHGGHTWTYAYDIRGRKITANDPDRGATKHTYNDLDQVTLTENANGDKIALVYDNLGRQIAQHSGSPTGPKLAERIYDTVRKGQLTSSTRYDGTASYTTKNTLFDNLNRPTSTNIMLTGLPAAESSLAPTNGYTFNTSYNLDGSVRVSGMPAAGGLGGESIAYAYDDFGRSTTTKSNLSSYIVGSQYTKTGKLIGRQLATSATGNTTSLSFTYELGTQRLKTATTVHDGQAGVDRSATYSYQDAGNIIQLTDNSRQGTDNQCFKYDDLQRLTDAWTQQVPAGGSPSCATSPDGVTLGGPAPYRTAYTYDETGNRKTEIQYGSSNQTISTRNYTYANGPGVDPKYKGHQLAVLTQTGQDARTETFGYDATGNTTSRNTTSGNTTFTWGVNGELTKATNEEGITSYAYDADGNRLIRRDPAGTTLYLPSMELRLGKGTTTPKATRYYGTDALRTSAGVTFLAADTQGTAQVAINPTNGSSSQRRYTPFGALRAAPNTWPTGDEHGFLGGTNDSSTGLTHLGAREYDPTLGRFISVDPLMKPNDPQQMNGYTYSNNNPVTFSDPSGLMFDPPTCGSDCYEAGPDDGPSGGNRTGGGSSPNGGNCGIRCHLKNIGNGLVDGAITGAIQPLKDLPRQIFYGMLSMGAAPYCAGGAGSSSACMTENHATTEGSKQTNVHLNLGGDPNSKTYKISKLIGEIIGIPAPGIGGLGVLRGIRAAAKLKAIAGQTRNLLKRRPPGASKQAEPPCSSFVPGTAVLMADGTHKPIEDVDAGDKVLATDPETGKTRPKPVLATITSKGDKNVVQITVNVNGPRAFWTNDNRPELVGPSFKAATADGGVIVATDSHPFWVAGSTNMWVQAGELKPGMWLRTSPGTYVQVAATKYWSARQKRVHNLTVAGVHTYYVLADTTPVLVHNAGECDNGVALGIKKEGNLRTFADDGGHTHFLDLTRDGALGEVRNVAFNQPGTELHIVLDGFDHADKDPAAAFKAAYDRGGGDNWFTTEREMRIVGESVRRGARDWGSIIFYRGGKRVDIPRPKYLGGE